MSISLKTNAAETSPISAKRTADLSRKRHCLVPGCSRDAVSRGCCSACLMTFRRHVASGKTSWKRLIDAGLVLGPTLPRSATKKTPTRINGCQE